MTDSSSLMAMVAVRVARPLSVLLLCVSMVIHIHAEIFTSMADMENMVMFEKKMLTELKKYIRAEEDKVAEIRKFVHGVDDVLNPINSTEDVGKYLGNPVNSYLMLKRFNVEWKKLERLLELDSSESMHAVFENLRPLFPTSEDHEGAMDALFRLQTTYLLQSSSLANGVIPGVQQLRTTQPLGVEDVFELGKHAYKSSKWPHAIQWFSTTLDKLGNHAMLSDVDKSDVLDHLAYSLFQFGDKLKAYRLTEELLKMRPDDQRVQENLNFFHQEVAQKGDSLGSNVSVDFSGDLPLHDIDVDETTERAQTMKKYEKLCRGEAREMTPWEKSKLKCWYRFKTNPLLRLKPQRVERIWVRPEILLFHDFLSDNESAWIKDTSYPMLQRATIMDPDTGVLRHADYRVSKSAWLPPEDYPQVRKLRTRATAVTGLDMLSSEHLQIANYGIGGHYEPHFDHAREEEDKFEDLGMGNRIATLLMYTSHVTAGGPTVFTNALAAVYPVKNAAVFWFNLHRNGRGNWETRHAACPVLVGQKWVSNWWIHEYRQEFRRPCALNPNW